MPCKVVFERPIEPHDAALYQAEASETGVAGWQDVDDDAVKRYRDQGYLIIRTGVERDAVLAARAELSAMTLSDDPRCASVYYESSIATHLGDRSTNTASATANGSKLTLETLTLGSLASELPPLESTLRARYVRKFMGFLNGHPPLAAIANHPRLLALIERLFHGSARIFQDMAMIKPPGGREKPWHQDHAYFNLPLDAPVVGVWIALNEVAPANGCMYVEPGGHRRGPVPHFLRRDWQICDGEIASRRTVALPMQAGDVLVFDSKLPHGTPRNNTSLQRWALQFHYVPTSAVECEEDARLAAFGAEGKGVSC